MGERLTGNFDQNHVDGFEAMQEDGDADNYSEAVRRASIVGLREMGYINGERTDTWLKQVVYRFAWLFTIAGVTGLAFTATYPIPTRLPSLAVGAFGGLLFGIYAILDSHEPKVTKRLKGLFGDPA